MPDPPPPATLPTHRVDADAPGPDPLATEWTLAGGLGGFAMGTAAGIPARRYHGLLVAARRPPIDRVMTLMAVADRVVVDADGPAARPVPLTSFHFRDAADRPLRADALARFEHRPGSVRWIYRIDQTGAPPAEVVKRLDLADRRAAAAIRYEASGFVRPWRLELRPLLALRDFHAMRTEPEGLADAFRLRPVDDGVAAASDRAAVEILAERAAYSNDPHVWRGFEYLWEHRRGDNAVEHLFCPGVFTAISPDRPVTLHAVADAAGALDLARSEAVRSARLARVARNAAAAPRPDAADTPTNDRDRDALARLAVAADLFVVERAAEAGPPGTTVIAGYPWFSDWGRDTMIALPGLLLACGRFDEAFAALSVFAAHRRRGLIPNRFDDYAGPAHYNTVDAPLWFLHAAAEYRRLADDPTGYAETLAPACLDIIDAFCAGTDHGIARDPLDGLVTAGDERTQLTWMDAQRGGVTFTPRHGKAVEINALWHHGLLVTADAVEVADPARARDLRVLADDARDGFARRFVRDDGRGLYDRLEPGPSGRWRPSPEIRPNQIFAVSLARSPLDTAHHPSVLETVRDHLLTPFGLRTLSPAEPGYIGRYEGDMMARDAAYHNGTVWPWLLGPFAEAVMRAGRFSPAARAKARGLLRPLIDVLDGPGCGSIPEVYDGDPPHRPDGCPAQAWSVAETLRVLALAVRGP